MFIQNVLEKIANAEVKAKRPAGSVTLIAVSKTKPLEQVLAATEKGIINFGENYVQEATKKIEKTKNTHPQLKWHLIGSLQTNKSKFVVGKFETIQSVDRLELAKTLNQRSEEAGVIQKILLQVKLGDEPTKAGCSADSLEELIIKLNGLKSIRVEGLMSLPPLDVEPEASRKFFVQLRQLRDKYSHLIPEGMGTFKELSMGTTHDYEIAIEEGATMVRVGTAIFGARGQSTI